MIRLVTFMVRLLFLPLEAVARLLIRRSNSNSIGAAVGRHSRRQRVVVDVHIPPRVAPIRGIPFDGVDLPLPPAGSHKRW